MINLHYVPVHFQAAVVALVNVGWKATLSLLNHYAYAMPLPPPSEPSHPHLVNRRTLT